jgi:hypothetical protein
VPVIGSSNVLLMVLVVTGTCMAWFGSREKRQFELGLGFILISQPLQASSGDELKILL